MGGSGGGRVLRIGHRGNGKYYVMVNFEDDGPTFVIISYVGGGGLLSRGWPGVERLPTPQKVVRALSHRR